jgi:hypothetical protein
MTTRAVAAGEDTRAKTNLERLKQTDIDLERRR